MGLFQRNTFNEETPLYEIVNTIGAVSNALGVKQLLIVGLGNIGKDYDGTRHNLGFEVLNYFAKKNDFSDWINKKDLFCQESSGTIDGTKVVLCKPTTFMNDSGKTVQTIQKFYKIPNIATLVVHDELDVKFGQIRNRKGGSSAGHNGIKSIALHCGEDFGRMRIGIGPKRPVQIDSADFVLGKFNKTQQKEISTLLVEANSMLSEYTYSKGALNEETRSFII